jgi:UDP-N-acetyl-D-mannosaminuronate dehydrogenase
MSKSKKYPLIKEEQINQTMRIIIIESTVYSTTEAIYKELLEKTTQISSKPYYDKREMDVSDIIEVMLPRFKRLGDVDYDFRL